MPVLILGDGRLVGRDFAGGAVWIESATFVARARRKEGGLLSTKGPGQGKRFWSGGRRLPESAHRLLASARSATQREGSGPQSVAHSCRERVSEPMSR
jgi:hypothetical protein